jgi:hypothetical protein
LWDGAVWEIGGGRRVGMETGRRLFDST